VYNSANCYTYVQLYTQVGDVILLFLSMALLLSKYIIKWSFNRNLAK